MKDRHFFSDAVLIAVIFAAALLVFSARLLLGRDGASVEVRVNGEVVATLSLSEDTEFDVAGTCLLKIENGEAWISSATCRNQICVRHRPIRNAGEAIVCLPNGVTVKVVGDGGADFVI